MTRLYVQMKNNNTLYFDFFTMAEAIEYRDERHMATNSAIARVWIESITFEEWKCSALT